MLYQMINSLLKSKFSSTDSQDSCVSTWRDMLYYVQLLSILFIYLFAVLQTTKIAHWWWCPLKDFHGIDDSVSFSRIVCLFPWEIMQGWCAFIIRASATRPVCWENTILMDTWVVLESWRACVSSTLTS